MNYEESTSTRRVRDGDLWIMCPTTYYTNFVYTDPLGVRHPFIGSTQDTSQQVQACNPPPSQPNFTALANDGSGYSLSVTNFDVSSVTSKTGEQFSPPSLQLQGAGVVMDSNGNEISTSGNGVFTDTLGTTALTIAGTAPNPQTFSYTNPQGTQSKYTLNYQAYTVATDFDISGVNEYGPTNVALVSSLQLPDGSSYSFTYEETPADASCTPLAGTYQGYCVTGRMISVTLPTEGAISYSYSGGTSGAGIYADGSTATLTRTLNPGGQWTYARALDSGTPGPGSTWTTTITDPASNETVSNFSEDNVASQGTYNLYETQRKVYEGSNTLLETRIDCYNSNYASCPGATITSPIKQTDIYTELPNGVARLSEVQYNGAQSGSGLLSQDTEYDYGVNQDAAPTTTPLERTVITYGGVSGAIGLPSESKVTSWTGGQSSTISDVLYYYDGSVVTPTSGTPQHVDVSFGNLTEIVTHTSSANSLQQSLTYYDTGEPNTVTDVNGAMTTYTYGSGTSCGNSFATSISEPLSLSRSMTWNCNGGVETSLIDENNKTIMTTYSDPNFWRPTAGQDQENNQTTVAYTGQNAAEATLSFNGGNSVSDLRTTLDGFGRPILNQWLQAPGSTNYDTREADYNSTNQVNRTTMPFSASAGGTNSSAPGVVANYDALGRVQSVTDAGGGTTNYTYANNDVLITSSGGQSFSKQLEYDGLGRITSVCEISTTLPGVGACHQSNAETGYLTKYTYDGLGHLLTVTQNAQGSSNHQTRTYSYDWAGRLLSESNPETGTTSYTYDSACGSYAASAGDMTKRVDNAHNTTCYAYDALHRLTDAGDNGAVCRHFRYDDSPTPYNNGTPPSGVTVVNTMTRVEEASTDACSYTTLQTDEWFSYSPRGELTDLYESTPHSGQYYHTTVSYWPSGTVETLSGIPSVPTLNYGAGGSGLDGEGRYTEVTASSGTNPVTGVTYSTTGTTNPLGALTSVTYGSSDTDGFSYDPNTGRPTQYVFSVNGATDTGTLTWNANATLGKLVIADHIPGTSDSQTCTFTYDDLARIGGQDSNGYSVDCGSSWQQLFTYDAFGNVTKTGNLSFQPTYSSATNQFTLSGDNVQYDGDGNLLADNLNSYTWDPNWGTMSSVNTGSTVVTATYDALGRVVEQGNGSTYTQILYSPIGTAALMNGSTLAKAFASLPGGGTAVYTSSGLAYYRHADWLGSSRLASTQSQGLYSSTAYAPFGEQYASSGTADPSFTGQNSDTVPSLYDFWFRRLSSSQGRWISPDPAGTAAVDPANPQTWNRYAYVLNSPLSYVDPAGLWFKGYVYDPASGCLSYYWTTTDPNTEQTTQQSATLWCAPDAIDTPGWQDPGGGGYFIYGGNGPHGGGGSSAPSNAVPANPCANGGRALPPSAYAQAGQAANGHPITFALDVAMGWPKGDYMDAQPFASGTTAQNAAYGNYVFGVYMQSAGFSLSQTLSGANAYAFFRSSYPAGTPMSPTYPSLPAANVANISNGFNAQAAGTTCHF